MIGRGRPRRCDGKTCGPSLKASQAGLMPCLRQSCNDFYSRLRAAFDVGQAPSDSTRPVAPEPPWLSRWRHAPIEDAPPCHHAACCVGPSIRPARMPASQPIHPDHLLKRATVPTVGRRPPVSISSAVVWSPPTRSASAVRDTRACFLAFFRRAGRPKYRGLGRHEPSAPRSTQRQVEKVEIIINGFPCLASLPRSHRSCMTAVELGSSGLRNKKAPGESREPSPASDPALESLVRREPEECMCFLCS